MENNLPFNLKYLRKKQRISVNELAEMIGKGKSMWYNYESGANEPTIAELIKISNFFGISISNIIVKKLDDSNVEDHVEDHVEYYRKDKTDPTHFEDLTKAYVVAERGSDYDRDKPSRERINELVLRIRDLEMKYEAAMEALEAVGRGQASISSKTA